MWRKYQIKSTPYLYIGSFDLTFSSLSPKEYIDYLQQWRHLMLRAPIDNAHENGYVPHTTFALKNGFQRMDVWAVGTLYVHDNGTIRVSGRVGVDNWLLLGWILGIVFGIGLSIHIGEGIAGFILISLFLGSVFIMQFLAVIHLTDTLKDFLTKADKPPR